MPITEHQGLRSLPSVDEVLRQLDRLPHLPRSLIVDEIRSVLEERREALLRQLPHDAAPIPSLVEQRLLRLLTPSLRSVINATGVILHTNLGRAPLDNFRPIGGYSNLE
jgi:L-seryl-tRNA(Ser) seleniumtransferase